MGFLDGLFGSSSPKSVSTLTKSQQMLSDQLVNFLSPGTVPNQQANPLSRIGQGATPYGGQIVPNLLPQYQQILSLLGQVNPQQTQGLLSQANQGLDATSGALGQLLGGRSAVNVSSQLPKGYLQNAIVSPAMGTFDTQIAPRIREGFGHVGAFSSMEGSTLGNALGQTNAAITQQYGQAQLAQQQLAQQLNAQGALQARQMQGTGIGLASQLSGQRGSLAQLGSNIPLSQALGFGQALAPLQQNAASQSQANYQDFLRTSPENSPWTQLALGIMGQQQKALYNPQNQFGQAIGNIGSLGLLAGMFGLI